MSKKSDKSPEKKPRAKKGEKPAKETAPKARKGKGVEQQPPEQPPQPPPPAPAGAAFRALPAGLPWVRVEADRGAAWERLTREQLERLSPFDAGDVIARLMEAMGLRAAEVERVDEEDGPITFWTVRRAGGAAS